MVEGQRQWLGLENTVGTRGIIRKGRIGLELEEQIEQEPERRDNLLSTPLLNRIYTDRRRGQVRAIQITLVCSQLKPELINILGGGVVITASLKALLWQKTM